MSRTLGRDEAAYTGVLGQTHHRTIMVASDLGQLFPASLCTSVHSADNASREALHAGTLHDVECPFQPGRVYKLAAPVIYHNPELRIFALLIPEALRQHTLRFRRELLEQLGNEEVLLPSYVQNFQVVHSPEQLRGLEEAGPDEATQLISLPAPPANSGASEANEVSDAERSEFEEARKQMEIERNQLDEVAARFDRERERMDEVESRLQREREEIEQLRQELERERNALAAAKLNLEEKSLRIQQGLDVSGNDAPVEKTQVVTDDQFIEVIATGDQVSEGIVAEESVLTSAPSEPEAVELPQGMDDDDFAAEEPTAFVQLVPERFDVKASAGRDEYVTVQEGQVIAAFRVDKDEIARLLQSEPDFFIQYHDIQDIPTVALLLARLGDDLQPRAFIAALLNVNDSEHKKVLTRLRSSAEVRFAFYGRDNKFLRSLDVKRPLEENVEWIMDELVKKHKNAKNIKTFAFRKAIDTYLKRGYERLGTMRHNFHAESFAELRLASETKLAAGIVGYWSSADTFEYLIANRSFPLKTFRTVQHRVIEAALPLGIYLNGALREIAVEMGKSDNESDLVQRLLANFAELNIGVGQSQRNDLDPLEVWENWDALLNLADELAVSPSQSEINLAELALKRAQEHQDNQASADESGEEIELSVDDLIIEQVSEATGVTYFLPDNKDGDISFDDMVTMKKGKLRELLSDPNTRLEAAQMLLSRFGNDEVPTVLRSVEQMNVSEVAALARYFERNADSMEGELVQTVENGGPSATYIAARALVASRSRAAIPALLKALRDDSRQTNREALARTIADYGNNLLPDLRRDIKRNGHDDPVIVLLVELEARHPGLLEELGSDRNKRIKKAVEQARGI